MATWDELFTNAKHVKRVPEPEIYRFISSLETLFAERPLRVWDLCCGAGRHTIALARLGHTLYASDSAPNAIALMRTWLTELGLRAKVAEADMTICPWTDVTFHGVVSWDALHHNTLGNIQTAVDTIYRRLLPGGLFLVTLKSTKADLYGTGREIEPDTFVPTASAEAGVPHHYFNEAGIRDLFKEWELISLAEQIITYVERAPSFLQHNPFPYTTWGVLARKRA